MDENFRSMKERLLAVKNLYFYQELRMSMSTGINSPEVLDILYDYYNSLDLKVGDIVRIDYDLNIYNFLLDKRASPPNIFLYGDMVVTELNKYDTKESLLDLVKESNSRYIEKFEEVLSKHRMTPITLKCRQMRKYYTEISYSKIFSQEASYIALNKAKKEKKEEFDSCYFENVFSTYDLIYMFCLRKNSNKTTDYESLEELIHPSEKSKTYEIFCK